VESNPRDWIPTGMELNQGMGDHQTEMEHPPFRGISWRKWLETPRHWDGRLGFVWDHPRPTPRPIKVGAIQHKLGVVTCAMTL
jgi:hypothetical protein